MRLPSKVCITILLISLSSLAGATATKKLCKPEIVPSRSCAPCTLDEWAKKVYSLKERPVQYSTLPHKKEYQKNILTLSQFIETLQKAATAIAEDSKKNDAWLGTHSLLSQAPSLFKLQRPCILPAKKTANYLFKPCAQRLHVKPESNVILFGDLHGSVHSLIRDLEKLRSLGYIDNNFKIVKKDTYILFLGDYIDRGIYGVEVMYTLARLKSANPHNVILVRGNHEDYVLVSLFKVSHTKAEEKDSAPSLLDELHHKFVTTDKDTIAIFRFYETLPVVLYLGCGNAEQQDYMQCCHGGIELGYNPHALLHADPKVRFELIDTLWRRKNFSTLSKKVQNEVKSAFDLDTLCSDIRDSQPKGPIWKDKATGQASYLGFLWNDFFVDPAKTVKKRGKKETGWVCGKALTEDVLSWGNSKTVTLHGAFRGHQHNNDTGGPMLNLLCCGKGMARIWDKHIYTFVSAPDSKLEDTGERCFTYDSFVIVKTAPTFKDWTLDHYFQDGGMNKPIWKMVSAKTSPTAQKCSAA